MTFLALALAFASPLFAPQERSGDDRYKDRFISAEIILQMAMNPQRRALWHLGDRALYPELPGWIDRGGDLPFEWLERRLTTMSKTLTGNWIPPNPAARAFRIQNWPSKGVETFGVSFEANGCQVLWARIGHRIGILISAPYLIERPNTKSEVVSDLTVGRYVVDTCATTLKLSRPASKASVFVERWDGWPVLYLGRIQFPIEVTQNSIDPPRWDDTIHFCTDGKSIFFVFDQDPILVVK